MSIYFIFVRISITTSDEANCFCLINLHIVEPKEICLDRRCELSCSSLEMCDAGFTCIRWLKRLFCSRFSYSLRRCVFAHNDLQLLMLAPIGLHFMRSYRIFFCAHRRRNSSFTCALLHRLRNFVWKTHGAVMASFSLIYTLCVCASVSVDCASLPNVCMVSSLNVAPRRDTKQSGPMDCLFLVDWRSVFSDAHGRCHSVDN